MTVKIVTDSTADLPPGVASELGITEVPLYIKFGDAVYRDRVDITSDEFFSRLESGSILPTTSPPTPQDFADVYRTVSKDADAIVSIHISSKMSETCASAIKGKELSKVNCPIEIIDSLWVSAALGMLVMDAARSALAGVKYESIVKTVMETIPRIDYLGMFDDLGYLSRGGRIGKAKAFLGTVLGVKLLLTIAYGEFIPVDMVYSYKKAFDMIYQLARTAGKLQEIAVVHSTFPDDAQALADRLKAILPGERINIIRHGPGIGVHVGPGTVGAVIRSKPPGQA
jgi:DegV family protein with EDD domain